ncbi:MAG: D-tyrosyl-tRNA(Tyr) deacylase [Bacteroidales bacterium]|nr:D-tyrosyl-tRNA(Tyr) deacylase [Candidatus Latescibacterota bacterium]
MRVVIQRVRRANVEVGGTEVSSIGQGILALAAFRKDDSDEELAWMARKCLELRIFEDDEGKMNLSLTDVGAELLVVSQFTLYGDCRKGRRPDYTDSAPSSEAAVLYRRFIEILESHYPRVSEGVFGAHMNIALLNDGPVTMVLDRDPL